MAALTAAWSFVTPLANDATRLDRAPHSQELEIGEGFLPNHGLERCDDLSRLDEQRHTLLDCGDGYGLGLGERVATNRHEPCDGARGWRPAQVAAVGLFRLAAACGPLADDPEAAAKPLPFEASPQLRSVPVSGCPLLVKPLQI